VATIDSSMPHFGEVLTFFDVAPHGALPTPTLLAFSLANNSKFVPLAPVDAGSLSAADVTAFAAAVAKAEVVPHIRSEGDSTTSRGGSAVVKLVGKTFDAAVKDPARDVFVNLYTPTCGHCKKLEPVWEEVNGSATMLSRTAPALQRMLALRPDLRPP